MTPPTIILTGKLKERFCKLLQADKIGGVTVLSPFILITTSKSKFKEHLLVAPLQFNERGVKAEFKKLKGSLLELYMTLPRVQIISDDQELGSRTEIPLTKAFKNNHDDIAVGVEFKNGVLLAWVPKNFTQPISTSAPSSLEP